MQKTPVPETRLDDFDAQKARIVDRLIIAIAIALLPIAGLVIYFASRDGWGAEEMLQLAVFGFIWLLALRRSFLTPRKRAMAITSFLMLAALSEVFRYGLVTATYPMLAIIPILGTVITGMRAGLIAIGMITAALIAIAWVTISGERASPGLESELLYSPEEWAVRIANFVIAAGIGVYVTGALHRFLRTSNQAQLARNAELEESQTRIDQSAKLAGLGHALTDQISGRVMKCDKAYAEMHGLTVEDFTSLEITNIIGRLIHEDDREHAKDVRRRLLNGEGLISELRHATPDGRVRSLRKIFSPLHPATPKDGLFEIICQDVTEAHVLQEQLFQAQKMDAIGKLTGGVAHDFNNLLAVILGNLELLDDEIDNPGQKELIRHGIDATLRGAELTRNMLSFARRAPLQPTIVDLNHTVRNMRNWIGRTLPSTIKVETSLLAGLWRTEVDASSAESGLLNLIVNARDAMPKGGKLTIETSNVRIDEDYVDLRGETIEPGRYVLLAVSDNGEGIDPKDLDRIFEPFFTRKPVGAGSGLGLSMLEGFMKQSGGTVRVYSEPGVGTTFKLYFAAAGDTVTQDRPERPPVPTDASGHHATILLVEDNSEVLTTIRTMLVKVGYRVLEATSGDEGLKLFQDAPDIDLLLTDIVMPGELQGTTLAKRLRELRNDLPVVFMSGYASEATVHGNGLRPQDVRIMKPVRRDDLLRAVAKALAQGSGNGGAKE